MTYTCICTSVSLFILCTITYTNDQRSLIKHLHKHTKLPIFNSLKTVGIESHCNDFKVENVKEIFSKSLVFMNNDYFRLNWSLRIPDILYIKTKRIVILILINNNKWCS